MLYYLLCFAVFVAAYSVNIFYISVLYHRGLTHGAVRLRPWLVRFTAATGSWVTGLDPKGWCCMHRMHHIYSDTPEDPHSPVYQGVFPLAMGQLRSYQVTLRALLKKLEPQTSLVSDLNFPVSYLNRKKLWILPYALQGALAIAIGWIFNAWLFAYCYWLGMMSHPIQGWMVNALAHRFGYRNFETPDNSRNNTLVAWLVAGEGFQNNHHYRPSTARFSARWWEFDSGYVLCKIGQAIGILDIVDATPAGGSPRIDEMRPFVPCPSPS